MNKYLMRLAAVFCLLAFIITIMSSCKSKTDTNGTGTTLDPFSVSEYPETVTNATVPASSTETTTGMFDDFATTTTPASTQGNTTNSSISIPGGYVPGITDPAIPTLPPTVDPNILSSTNPNSTVDLKKLLSAFGYAYDPEEDCFYSEVDSWQRHGGFAPHYDLGGFLLNMHYLTFTVDFDWGGESWRLQFWKGNYSTILDGAEIGVYTKPLGADTQLYASADDQHLLSMSMELFKKNPRNASNRYFGRPATDHWWLTGFKIVNSNAIPGKMVLICDIRFRDSEMADSFAASLQQVRGSYSALVTFRPVSKKEYLTDDTFYRNGNTVTMCWRAVGYLNYDFPESETTTKAN